ASSVPHLGADLAPWGTRQSRYAHGVSRGLRRLLGHQRQDERPVPRGCPAREYDRRERERSRGGRSRQLHLDGRIWRGADLLPRSSPLRLSAPVHPLCFFPFPAPSHISTLSLYDALPISDSELVLGKLRQLRF